MLILILGTTLAAVLFYYVFVKPMSFWKKTGVNQGNPKWLIGDIWGPFFQIQSFTEMIQSFYNQTPGTRYFGMYQFTKPILLLKDPDLIKEITVKDFEHFTDHRSFVPENSDPLWSKNLIALKGEPWRDMRSILSPSFTSSKMKSMFVLIADCAENFVQHFRNKNEEMVTLEFKEVFTRFTNDVIATTAFGVKVDSLSEPNNDFFLMGKDATDMTSFWKSLKIFGFLVFPQILDVLKLKLFSDKVENFFSQLVNDTIQIREEKGIVRPDMIHLLMEARKGIHEHEENGVIDTGFATAQESQESNLGKRKMAKDLSNEDITAQALLFFFGGFDTVSTQMSFVAYELALNQDVQDKLRKEVFDSLTDSGGQLTYESLSKMTYMDMVISETMRLWPNGAATDRVCTKPYTIEPVTPEEKPVYLEKGTTIFIPMFPLHRDPKYYPNPERFDPERFNEQNKGNIKPYTYLPFGLGPRNCIGSRFALLEMKAVFFHILQHFELVPVERTQIPLEISKKSFPLTAANGFWLGLKRIKH